MSNDHKIKIGRPLSVSTVALGFAALFASATLVANAQIGSGWTQYFPTYSIHLDDSSGLHSYSWTSYKSVGSPICADYQYTSSTDTHRFRILDNRSNRSEIRVQNDYGSGHQQFQGYVTFSSPLNDECLFQIFGSTAGATQMMLRGYSDSGGSIRSVGTPSATISTFCYGVEKRINVIHIQGNYIQIYRNGTLMAQGADNESVVNYHKFGCYGTVQNGATTPAVVYWRAVKHFQQ